MKSISFVFKVVVAFSVLCLQPVQAKAWLTFSVPAIEGTVTDATTGQPIKDAVLVVKWQKTVYGPWDPQTSVIEKKYVSTDKKGVFRIPARKSFHIFSSFTNVHWVIRHPAYETDDRGISREQLDAIKLSGRNDNKSNPNIPKRLLISTSGVLIDNMALLSLREKFKEKSDIGGIRGNLYHELIFEGPRYFLVAKRLGIPVDSDLIFKEWDEIASDYADDVSIQTALESGKSRAVEGNVEGD